MWSNRTAQSAWSRLSFSQSMAKPSSFSRFRCSAGNESESLRAATDTKTRVFSSCATMLTGEAMSSAQGCSMISYPRRSRNVAAAWFYFSMNSFMMTSWLP